VVRGGELHDGVEAGCDEVCELNLDDRPQPHERHAAGGGDVGVLGHRHVPDPEVAELCCQALRHLEGAAELATDVCAENQDVVVATHLLGESLGDGVDVAQRAAHSANTPSVTLAGSGSGLTSA
jgi:hypothetical protein